MIIEKTEAAADPGFLQKLGMVSPTINANSLSNLVTSVIDIMLFVAGTLAIIYLIYSGILYLTAAGNADAAKKGQSGIINAIIGVVVIVLAYFLVSAVASYVSSTAGSATTTP